MKSLPSRGLRLAVVRGLLVVLAMGGAASGYAAPPLQSAQGLTFVVRAGFDGYYKEGFWIPVRITVANDGPDLSGSLHISMPRDFGGAETVVTRVVELPTQSRREIFLYVVPEGVISTLKVSLVNEKNKEIASASVRMAQTTLVDVLYGVLAASPSAFNGLADLDPGNGAAFVAQIEPGDLPPAARGWQALDVLVVSDVDTGALSPEQRTALAGWVAGGGRLIVAGGPSWQKTAAGLSDLLPVSPASTRTQTDLSGLGNFAASVAPEGSAVAAEGALAADAVVVASAGDLPLVVSRPAGLGQVTFLALDPAFAPLKGWDGFEGLFRNVLSPPVDRPGWVSGFSNWSSARDAVTALPNLELPSTWQVCGFLLIYLIVIGPLNYMVLKRLKRREWAWLTIPGLVLVFSGAAYVSGYQLSGTRALLHQLTVVQVWPDSDRAQVDEIVGLFSPRRTNYDLEFAPGFLVRPMPSYGGYSSTPRTLNLEQGDRTRLAGLGTEVGAVEAFVAQGDLPAPHFATALTLQVAANGALTLKGTLSNLSELSLTNALLLAPGPGNVRQLGEFKPGETETISLSLGSARARPMPPNAITPAVPTSVVGLKAPFPSYPGSSYDTTLDDIFGTSGGYYYNDSDREQYRRFALFSSVYDQYNSGGRGNGIYLVGWTSTAPASTRVTNRNFSTLDTTLYLIALRPEIDLGAGTHTIPPALMTWTPLEASDSNGTASPYDFYAYSSDRYALRFAPSQPLAYSAVEQLTLRLSSYGVTGIPDLRVDLWDYSEQRWSAQASVRWGDNSIADPERFVGPGGEIQVRVENLGALQVNVENLDFTLVVRR